MTLEDRAKRSPFPNTFMEGARAASEELWVIDPRGVHVHVGHWISIVEYAAENLAIECEDCGEVIADIDFRNVCDQEFMAGSHCVLPIGHSGSHRDGT